ncbi:signal transducer and transcription activator-like [Anastrepha ludens]|uniref:signal transducer and transcription activator-like n=1 Tax=Anastrepha ludens TaxID=28586 RepID=UPI0023AF618F|nr:signal transducer and transcription activator-like [Anastrepha ludens]
MNVLPINGPPTPPLEEVALASLYTHLQKLAVDNETMRASIQNFQNDQDMSHNMYTDFDQSPALLSLQPLGERDLFLEQQQQQYFNLRERKNRLILGLGTILGEYGSIQNHVIRSLKIWQRKQALSANGAPFPDNLDEIQYFVEALMDLITEIIALINNLLYFGDEPTLNEILNHARGLHNVLIFSAFIVEKQPPQVIKKSSKFPVTVRWLIGEKLDIHRSKPKIKCEILSEAQAKRLAVQNSGPNFQIPPASNGEMTGNECPMEYDISNRNFAANFTNLVIKQIQRSERRGPEIVMDEKCTLLFYTTTVYKEYEITCWTLTLPLVVVVHGSQEPQSLATITWDNAFSVIEREPFKVPDKVHYTKLLEALNMKFAFSTGRHLTAENFEFLREKLLFNDAGQVNEYISYSQFCRDKLPDRGFTFWEWFYAIMKLTKEHLKQMWVDGLIVGFINKRKTMEQILPYQENGTFLLRFSDSELGGITIAFRDDCGNIMILAPWTSNDLHTRSLADRIRDLDVLKIVYPKMLQRDAAFGSFYTQQIGRRDYVSSILKVQIAPQPPSGQQISVSTGFDNNDWQALGLLEALGSGEESTCSFNSNGTSIIGVQPVQCFGL